MSNFNITHCIGAGGPIISATTHSHMHSTARTSTGHDLDVEHELPLGEAPGEWGVAGRLGEGSPDSPTPAALPAFLDLLASSSGLEDRALARACVADS